MTTEREYADIESKYAKLLRVEMVGLDAQGLVQDHGCDGSDSDCDKTCPVTRYLDPDEIAAYLATTITAHVANAIDAAVEAAAVRVEAASLADSTTANQRAAYRDAACAVRGDS